MQICRDRCPSHDHDRFLVTNGNSSNGDTDSNSSNRNADNCHLIYGDANKQSTEKSTANGHDCAHQNRDSVTTDSNIEAPTLLEKSGYYRFA